MEKIEEKLKKLNSVTPDKEFVLNTKTQILGKKETFDFTWLKRRAFLVAPLMIIMGLFLGWNFYRYNVRYPRISSADLADLEAVNQDLQGVQEELMLARERVARIKEPSKVLAIKDEVELTAQGAEEVVRTSREVARDPRANRSDSEVFSVMTGVESTAQNIEKAARELEESYITRQKEIVKEQIEELEGRSLNAEQEVFLQEAKDLYNKGRFEEALQTVLQIQSY